MDSVLDLLTKGPPLCTALNNDAYSVWCCSQGTQCTGGPEAYGYADAFWTMPNSLLREHTINYTNRVEYFVLDAF